MHEKFSRKCEYMIEQLFRENYITIVTIILSFVTIIRTKGLNKRLTKLFVFGMIFLSILVVADALDYYLSNSMTTLSYFRYVTSIIGYSLKPCVLVFVLFTFLRFEKDKKIYFYLSIPLFINFLLCLFTPFTKWVFSFSDTNHFIRGPLSSFPFIVFGFYLLVLIFFTIKRGSLVDKTELLLVFISIIFLICAVIYETETNYKYVVNGTGVVTLVFYYLYLHTKNYKRDSLTNLLNRNSYYNDVESLRDDVYVVCLDMNNLKKVNDTYGHAKGDEAIIAIAQAINHNISKRDVAYRIGGYEFTILMREDEIFIRDCLDRIEKELSLSGFSVAYGYDLYCKGYIFDSVQSSADAKMYDMKKRMKQKEENVL